MMVLPLTNNYEEGECDPDKIGNKNEFVSDDMLEKGLSALVEKVD